MTLERISTGIATLDALIEGGIPKGFTVLVAGILVLVKLYLRHTSFMKDY